MDNSRRPESPSNDERVDTTHNKHDVACFSPSHINGNRNKSTSHVNSSLLEAMWPVVVYLWLLAVGLVPAEGSRPLAAATVPGCSCTGQQQHDQQQLLHISDSLEAGGQQHVLMKVRMLPTAAATLLSASRAGSTDPVKGPNAWVGEILSTTAAATAQQLKVPQSMLHVTLEASLGSGLLVPVPDSSRQQTAVDALAEFYEETTGSTALLVGLNMITNPASAAQTSNANKNSSSGSQPSNQQGSAAARSTVLALATLNGPLGDVANTLRMAEHMHTRCRELFSLGAVISMSTSDSNSSCARWLADWYLPVLRPEEGAAHSMQSKAVAAGTRKAAAGRRSVWLMAERPQTPYATVALPLEVNMKLSIKLSLPQQGGDTSTLLARAREWLQSPSLRKLLQQHGLSTASGSPGHLVTLMSAPELDSSVIAPNTVTPSSSNNINSSTNAAHHPAQHELGVAYWRNKAQPVEAPTQAAAGSKPWSQTHQGPHQLQPLVLGHTQGPAELSTAQRTDGAEGTSAAAEQDEVSRQTVLGAVVGAVVGSAAVGAALAMAVVLVVRRRRAQKAGSPAGCSSSGTCQDGSSRHGRAAPRDSTSSGSGRRRRSRGKRSLKYLPSMPPAHLLPIAALPDSPNAASSCGSSGMTATGAICAGSEQQQVPTTTAVAAGPSNAVLGAAATGSGCSDVAASSSAARMQLQAVGTAASPAVAMQANTATVLVQTRSLPVEPPAEPCSSSSSSNSITLEQRHSVVQQLRAAHSGLGSRLRQGLGLLRPAASDPLLQPHRSRTGVVSQQDASTWQTSAWAASDSSSSSNVLTRQELCSDSALSAARMDLMQALQRPGSGGSSTPDGSELGRSNSSNSNASSRDSAYMGGRHAGAVGEAAASAPSGQGVGVCSSPCSLQHVAGPEQDATGSAQGPSVEGASMHAGQTLCPLGPGAGEEVQASSAAVEAACHRNDTTNHRSSSPAVQLGAADAGQCSELTAGHNISGSEGAASRSGSTVASNSEVGFASSTRLLSSGRKVSPFVNYNFAAALD